MKIDVSDFIEMRSIIQAQAHQYALRSAPRPRLVHKEDDGFWFAKQ